SSIRVRNRLTRADLTDIPVNFPVSREFGNGDGFDLDCVRHHPVWLSGTLWRLVDLPRRWRAFLLSACGLSVPVGALACIEAPVSARKNSVPGAAGLFPSREAAREPFVSSSRGWSAGAGVV